LNIVILLIAYLLGSIPSAIWVGKRFYNIDVREYGSGNAGATNTFRVLGKKAGIPVLLMDIIKGFVAVNFVRLQDFYTVDDLGYTNLQLMLGILAVLGHIFPVFAGFRGGKGIATLLGIIIAVHPVGAGVAIALFLVILLLTKYVSLGSMLGAVSFPITVILGHNTDNGRLAPALIIFSILIAILVLLTHQKNIARLLRNEESKTYLFGKRDKTSVFDSEEDND
jgi:acyl phosphate:glycerol-3-phosphate acyltransferase